MSGMQAQQFGPFELLDRIGSGGMADVFKARLGGPKKTPQYLALKRMRTELSRDPQWVEMFTAEARITAKLNHPNIVQVFDFGRCGEIYYLAMELIEGRDLAWVMKRAQAEGRTIPLPIAIAISLDLCKALGHAHQLRDTAGKLLGLVHRDVSPHNVLVSKFGQVKLVDFGIAKAIHRAQETTHGKLKGKYAYMAPEQLHNDPVDRRTDIFAMGTLLYEMLIIRPLFQRRSIPETMKAVLDEPVPPPSSERPDLPGFFDDVILKALARAPRDRYDHAAALAADLTDFAEKSCGIATRQQVAAWLQELSASRAMPRPNTDVDETSATFEQVVPPRRRVATPMPGPIHLSESDTSTLRRAHAARRSSSVEQRLAHVSGESTIDESFGDKSGEGEGFGVDDTELQVHPRFAAQEPPPSDSGFRVDVEQLLARRKAQLSSAEHTPPPEAALPIESEELYAITSDEEPTAASPARTLEVLVSELESYPSAEVLSEELASAAGDVTTEMASVPAASDVTSEFESFPGAHVPDSEFEQVGSAEIVTSEEATSPKLAPGEGFDDEADTVLRFKKPGEPDYAPGADLDAWDGPARRAYGMPSERAVAYGESTARVDVARQVWHPVASPQSQQAAMGPLQAIPEAKPQRSPLLWVSLVLLTLAVAAGASYLFIFA